ncbi:hypothetical protein LEP1GSC187_0404 [Leptospira santarosai str. ZUN179]|uniref:Uncharacterized protein n=1 Tax=Leptospira santarosai str. ZUN179 TaxID=1049985 RepID=M6UU38_9LEPT|nr:hypothetical protein LEP1GSC071_1119 [Leptospira santarosai str. JET]EMM86918.1 hypothetical protein LEP1GSC039_1222 [Leptospira santarosai str. 2000027870]EMO44514.1 hypothetical protein LEP1GSC187_0404 [Leptospira santarosai str. ZUN179]EMO71596.1 hypothetical protein LEP1GSC130_1709 [Leptospira santarosai str. 200403458]
MTLSVVSSSSFLSNKNLNFETSYKKRPRIIGTFRKNENRFPPIWIEKKLLSNHSPKSGNFRVE